MDPDDHYSPQDADHAVLFLWSNVFSSAQVKHCYDKFETLTIAKSFAAETPCSAFASSQSTTRGYLEFHIRWEPHNFPMPTCVRVSARTMATTLIRSNFAVESVPQDWGAQIYRKRMLCELLRCLIDVTFCKDISFPATPLQAKLAGTGVLPGEHICMCSCHLCRFVPARLHPSSFDDLQ